MVIIMMVSVSTMFTKLAALMLIPKCLLLSLELGFLLGYDASLIFYRILDPHINVLGLIYYLLINPLKVF